MISFFSKTTRTIRKPRVLLIQAEGLKINWNWLYFRSPFIFGTILGLGTILFILWLIF